MADDHDPHCVEEIDDGEYEDDDEDEEDDEPYDVNKEDDLGEPEDDAQDEFERRLEEFEILAERASPIENTAREIELREKNKKNAEMKEYVHRMGPKTFGEKRPEWVYMGLYPKSLLVASNKPSSSTIPTLLEHTQELVEGKFEPSVENDPFTMALGRPYHPGRVVGSGGSLLGWQKVPNPTHVDSRELDNPTPYEYPELQVICNLLP
ncbi:nonsense-mediated mRNA decay protein 2-like [Chenopodium quinoa]|uniref:nonsense-mediated mRNA decay protein 2-like n=1 Tax=Chenopodium quinoa TaxID=63459 RepID=UPI000B7906D3|nr:nonsense-mediated mRNA decay protein 2-like [Chenopodium quinoa]